MNMTKDSTITNVNYDVQNTIIESHGGDSLFSPNTLLQVKKSIDENGWALLRGFSLTTERFSELLLKFCNTLTFDPARQFFNGVSQKVDAGSCAVGLHIENGNTPFPPKIVAFYSEQSAVEGSQTTICDGVELFNLLPLEIQNQWQQKVTVKRTLPSQIWRQYVIDQHPSVNKHADVTEQHLNDLIKINSQQRGSIDEFDNLDYELDIEPCLQVSRDQKNALAFANAILGPSFNYQKPTYTFANGEVVSEELIEKTGQYAEKCTREVQWKNGDVVLIDNHRVLHGRRAIVGPVSDRKLYIGMGS